MHKEIEDIKACLEKQLKHYRITYPLTEMSDLYKGRQLYKAIKIARSSQHMTVGFLPEVSLPEIVE